MHWAFHVIGFGRVSTRSERQAVTVNSCIFRVAKMQVTVLTPILIHSMYDYAFLTIGVFLSFFLVTSPIQRRETPRKARRYFAAVIVHG